MRMNRLVQSNSYLRGKVDKILKESNIMAEYSIEQKASFRVKGGLEFLDLYLKLRGISKEDLKKIKGAKTVTKKDLYSYFLEELKTNEMGDEEV
jgi:hypothetical protein